VATDRPDARLACRSFPGLRLVSAGLLALLAGCAGASDHYLQVDQSLRQGDPERAVQLIESAEPAYGTRSRLLYRMDRGMALHLAGQNQASNEVLEQAEQDVEEAYTRRVRTEAKAFFINDTELPYEGDPYEQVMINVVKALNFAVSGEWEGALVEARRIDRRLNLLADQAGAKDGYRDDGFARYVSAVLYEATGDLNNAFIAYRNAYEAYRKTLGWSRMPIPPSLQEDLLRTTEALHFTQEHDEYRRAFPDAKWRPISDTEGLAQLVVVSYNGRAPYKEDLFIDLPVSMEALNLVLLNRGLNRPGHQTREGRMADSALYGLSGSVVRVALPKLVPQKSAVARSEVSVAGAGGAFTARTELVNNVTAVAERTLADRFTAISLKAVARAAVKHALAEGVGQGTRAAMGNNNAGPWVGLLVMFLGKALAVYTEEADKRSWRTLPDEIQLARLWAPPGTYEVRVRPVTGAGGLERQETRRTVTLQRGATHLLVERVLP
jgi:hypothetical protein